MTNKDILIRELRKIRNDDDFIIGVISNAKTEENYELVLEFIKQDIDVTPPNLLMLSLDLNKGGKEYYDKYWKLEKESQD
jgi:hypothetical protein